MSIAQTYILVAAEGQEEAMVNCLERMAATVRPLVGCESVILLQDEKNPRRCIFIETFEDVQAREASAAMIPKEILKGLMATLNGQPDGSTYRLITGV